jgi:hypothetical protein
MKPFLIYPNQIFIYRQKMSHVPNIKYKTEYCLFWQQGKPPIIQQNYVKKDTPVSLLMEIKN